LCDGVFCKLFFLLLIAVGGCRKEISGSKGVKKGLSPLAECSSDDLLKKKSVVDPVTDFSESVKSIYTTTESI